MEQGVWTWDRPRDYYLITILSSSTPNYVNSKCISEENSWMLQFITLYLVFLLLIVIYVKA